MLCNYFVECDDNDNTIVHKNISHLKYPDPKYNTINHDKYDWWSSMMKYHDMTAVIQISSYFSKAFDAVHFIVGHWNHPIRYNGHSLTL